jgi:hypothetical protein
MDYTTLVGLVGASIILVGFLLNQTGRLNADSLLYDVLNAVGSLVLIYYAVLLDSYPFVVLNAVWLIVSAHGLYKSFRGSELN